MTFLSKSLISLVFLAATALGTLITQATNPNPVVDLGYAKYKGARNANTG